MVVDAANVQEHWLYLFHRVWRKVRSYPPERRLREQLAVFLLANSYVSAVLETDRVQMPSRIAPALAAIEERLRSLEIGALSTSQLTLPEEPSRP